MSGVCSFNRSISARQSAMKSLPFIVRSLGGSNNSTRMLLASLQYDNAATRFPSANSDTRKNEPIVVISPVIKFTVPMISGAMDWYCGGNELCAKLSVPVKDERIITGSVNHLVHLTYIMCEW